VQRRANSFAFHDDDDDNEEQTDFRKTSVFGRAVQLWKRNQVSLNASMQVFNVRGHNQSRVVELKKKGWICSCNSKTFCSHIIAVHLSIGLKQECGKMPNAENLRNNNKPKRLGKAGRKQPRSIDIPKHVKRQLLECEDGIEAGLAGMPESLSDYEGVKESGEDSGGETGEKEQSLPQQNVIISLVCNIIITNNIFL